MTDPAGGRPGPGLVDWSVDLAIFHWTMRCGCMRNRCDRLIEGRLWLLRDSSRAGALIAQASQMCRTDQEAEAEPRSQKLCVEIRLAFHSDGPLQPGRPASGSYPATPPTPIEGGNGLRRKQCPACNHLDSFSATMASRSRCARPASASRDQGYGSSKPPLGCHR